MHEDVKFWVHVSDRLNLLTSLNRNTLLSQKQSKKSKDNAYMFYDIAPFNVTRIINIQHTSLYAFHINVSSIMHIKNHTEYLYMLVLLYKKVCSIVSDIQFLRQILIQNSIFSLFVIKYIPKIWAQVKSNCFFPSQIIQWNVILLGCCIKKKIKKKKKIKTGVLFPNQDWARVVYTLQLVHT